MEKRQPKYAQVPCSLIFNKEILHVTVRVYAALRSYRNEKTRSAVWPSRKTLADGLGCSVSTVDRSIKKLCSAGHIGYIKGHKGKSNSYQFYEIAYQHSVTHDAVSASPVKPSSIMDDGSMASSTTPQPESGNQNHEPRSWWQFRHRGDIAHVKEDGSIVIKTHMNEWKTYGGGDEDSFRYGPLQGTRARRAAEAYSKTKHGLKEAPGGIVSSLPTEGEGLNLIAPQHRSSTI